MSDVHCAVCREPWDTYHIRHDAPKWAARLFRLGAGCEACEGVPPAGMDPDDAAEDFARDVVLGSAFEGEGEAAALDVLETPRADRPAWTRPEPRVLETCAGCGVRVVVDPDDEKTLEWDGGRRVHFQGSSIGHAYGDLYGAEDLPELADWDDERPSIFRAVGRRGPRPAPTDVYCPGCVQPCGECDAIIFARSELEAGDTYAPGTAFPDPRDEYHADPICVDCLEEIPTCSHCSAVLGDDEADEDGRCEGCAPEPDDDAEPDDDDADPVPGPAARRRARALVRKYNRARHRVRAAWRRYYGCRPPVGAPCPPRLRNPKPAAYAYYLAADRTRSAAWDALHRAGMGPTLTGGSK